MVINYMNSNSGFQQGRAPAALRADGHADRGAVLHAERATTQETGRRESRRMGERKLLSRAYAASWAGKQSPGRTPSRRLLESREQDQVNHSHKYSVMATLHPAVVLALEHI